LCGFFTFLVFSCPESFAVEGILKKDDGKPTESKEIIDTTPVPDEQIKDRIRSVLLNVEDYKDVDVEVLGGVVRLSGEIAREGAKDKIESLVSRFRGVLFVDNRIKSTTEVEKRVVPVLDRFREYMGRILAQLPLILVAVVVTGLFWFIGSLIGRIAPRYGWFGINPMIKNVISRLFTAVFVIAGIIIALDILDVTALFGAVVGTAGIAGLAIGFAFKDIVENYLAGLLLSIRALFSINDHVLVGDHEGRVVRLTSRELVVMTLDGNHVLIPNAMVFKSVIVNFSRNRLRRFDFTVGVGVSEDLLEVRKLGLQTLDAMNGVIEDPGPYMRIVNLGDFAINVQFFGWIDQRESDLFKVRSEAIRLIKEAFDAAGIEMPYPTYISHAVTEAVSEAPRARDAQALIEAEAASADVSVDKQLDPQIEEDLKRPDEDNYLKNVPIA
jgi:small conductance mechanosensitive channel